MPYAQIGPDQVAVHYQLRSALGRTSRPETGRPLEKGRRSRLTIALPCCLSGRPVGRRRGRAGGSSRFIALDMTAYWSAIREACFQLIPKSLNVTAVTEAMGRRRRPSPKPGPGRHGQGGV